MAERDRHVPAVETIAWIDMRGVRNGGKRSRLHRVKMRSPMMRPETLCGLTAPRFGLAQCPSNFVITAEESRGRCLRCFPWHCHRCRERRFMVDEATRPFLCCSSHRKRLCHTCYRVTHFVEVCGEGCERCKAEGLPVIWPPRKPEPARAGAT